MTNVIGLVEKQLSNNMQNSMRTNKPSLASEHVGSTLAQYFYYFLRGNINKLPDFSTINQIIEKKKASRDRALLSEGYGMLVRLVDGEIVIDYDEPITSKSIRRDIITKDYYGASIIYDYDRDPEVVNVNDLPVFDIRRIKHLQQYLQQYKTYCESNSNQQVQK